MDVVALPRRTPVAYRASNESLSAIAEAAKTAPPGNTLAIASSGDAAAALLTVRGGPYALVDMNPHQLEFAQYRLKALQAGDLQAFHVPLEERFTFTPDGDDDQGIEMDYCLAWMSEHLHPERIQAAQKNARHLTFFKGDIYGFLAEGGFTHAYLSNVPEWDWDSKKEHAARAAFEAAAANTEDGARIHVMYRGSETQLRWHVGSSADWELDDSTMRAARGHDAEARYSMKSWVLVKA